MVPGQACSFAKRTKALELLKNTRRIGGVLIHAWSLLSSGSYSLLGHQLPKGGMVVLSVCSTLSLVPVQAKCFFDENPA
jgi:hypothetical protein